MISVSYFKKGWDYIMFKITDAEYEVMKVVWKNPKITSPEIISKVSENTSWSRPTIKTLISRLAEKKILKVQKDEGSLYLYSPEITEEEYKEQESKNFIKKIFNGSVNEMLLSFTKNKTLTKNELEELIKLIDEGE